MTRIFVLSAVLCLSAITAGAQDWNGPNPLEEKGIGIMYWKHPLGDQSTLPCTHVVPQHPNGHATTVPCAHMVPQHPNGHATTVPCAHLEPAHKNGDPVKVACLHIMPNGQPQHPNGHTSYVPCTHLEPKHPNGHNGPTVVCAHLVPQHSGGHPGPTVACAHMVQQHPQGHQGPKIPCVHPMPVKRHVPKMNLFFYTDDAAYQKEVIRVLNKLKGMGVDVTALRPLHCFFRPATPAGEFPAGATNPTWPHYNGAFHSIQVQPWKTWKEVLHHELGHATLGNSCIRITGGGGQHTMEGVSRPGVAMSEGWAHFVALALTMNQNTGSPVWRGYDWEAGTRSNGDSVGKPSPNIEFRVGCALWDLHDKVTDGRDTVTLTFSDLFRVYSPSLQILTKGPFIPNFADYVKRLKQNHPALQTGIDAIRIQNTEGTVNTRRPLRRRPGGR